jgi:hypothetical protein
MRQDRNAREITVDKQKLIEQINTNKANHQQEYAKAVEAYKREAKKQLDEQLKALKNGSLSINVNLVAPSNKSEEYDKIASMFEWETSDTVVLSQGEFNEYVLDETDFARQAKIYNSAYLSLGS